MIHFPYLFCSHLIGTDTCISYSAYMACYCLCDGFVDRDCSSGRDKNNYKCHMKSEGIINQIKL